MKESLEKGQPGFKDIPHRASPHGYPNADRVMQTGIILPCHHGLSEEDIAYIHGAFDGLLQASA